MRRKGVVGVYRGVSGYVGVCQALGKYNPLSLALLTNS